jgi:transcriptional regulator with XRE-family HTH domain
MPGRRQESLRSMTVSDRFGENVLRIRQARKLTQETLAERAQIHRTQITLVETGRRQPGIETVVRLAGALEVPTESLFDGIRWDPRAGEFLVEDPPELPRV